MFDDEMRKRLARASAKLAALEITEYGNTVHFRGINGNWCPCPQAGKHADGNGGWVAFPGGAEIAGALVDAAAGLQTLIDHIMELEQ